MRIITSTSAAARLDAARAFLGARSPRPRTDHRRRVARRGGRSRARGRAPARLDLRHHPLQPHRARGARGRRASRRRAARAGHAGRRRSDRRPRGVRRARRGRARVFRAGRAHARFSEGAGAHAARAASRRRRRDEPANCRTTNARTAERRTTNVERRTIFCSLLARVEAELERSSVDDRAALFRLAAASCRAGHVRWAQMPMLLLDVPLDSRAEQDFAAALIARSPDVLATVPDGDLVRARRASRLGGRRRRDVRRQRPESEIRRRIWPVCGGTCFRPSVRPRASGPATSCCFRRRARGAKRDATAPRTALARPAAIPAPPPRPARTRR